MKEEAEENHTPYKHKIHSKYKYDTIVSTYNLKDIIDSNL